MLHLSRLFRLRKRRLQQSSKPARRRQLLAGFESLEERRLLAIDTTFATGVLTFTGDFGGVSNDKVILESTATPGTVNYDDGSGLGSTTVTGVNSVVFNAGSGMNEMIVINQAPSVFRPFAGAAFNIAFNNATDANFDILRIAGGSAATITSGNYAVSSPTSGTISYNSTFTPINISFSGLSSTGVTPDRVDDVTIQGGAFTTNTSTGSESVVVKVGPVLPPIQSFVQGPVFIDGGDRDDHGHHDSPAAPGGTNEEGWFFIQEALNFVHTQKTLEFGNAANDILAIGVHPGQANNALINAAGVLGLNITYADSVADINAAVLSPAIYDLIYVPSNDNNTAGGILDLEEHALVARKADIQAYIRSGGGLVALTAAASGSGAPPPYAWLELPALFTIQSFGTGGITNNLRKTPAAIAAGFTITDAELSLGDPYHNVFTGPPGFNGLDIFVLDTGPDNIPDDIPPSDDRAVTLGQGAINQTVGGAATTTISGNQMTLINVGNKLTLNLNALGGTDSILVDGSVNSLNGLLAPLNVNGGGNGDSLSITDSADATGDAVSVTTLATTGLASFPITYAAIGSLSVQATQGADTMTVDLAPPAPGLTNVTVLGGLSGDLFTGLTGYIRPSGTIALSIHGGTAAAIPPPGIAFNPFGESPDKFNLDMTTRADGSPVLPVVIVDTNGGNAISSNTQLVRFTGIEDIDVLDGGLLTNTEIGDFYLRGTDNPDYILFASSGQVDPTFRVRFGNVYYPATGAFGPYSTATGKIYAYGRGGNDTISMYNTRVDGVLFGEEDDDILTGGYGNDLLIGGQGNDRINGGTVGGNDEVWGDDFDPVADVPLLAAGNPLTHPANRAGGNDQVNTFGGNDKVYGQGGNDIINTGNGDDYINGGPGNDQIDGQAGNDRMYGGDGSDVINGSNGNDLVVGGAGNDFIYGGNGDDVLIGGLDVDMLNGSEGGDLLQGDDDANSESLNSGDSHDAVLMALLNQWVAFKTTTNLTPLGTDGSKDTLWGGKGTDLFLITGTDVAADKNAPGYGPDLP